MTTRKEKNAQHSLLARLILASILIVFLGFAVLALWWLKGWFVADSRLVVPPSHLHTSELYKGKINGIPISVPRNYIYFPIEYKDRSVWDPRKAEGKLDGQQKYKDAVGAFTVYVHWPDMKPRDWESDFQRSDNKQEQYRWLLIEVIPYSPEAVGKDLGWAPVLVGTLERLSEETLADRPVEIIDSADLKGRRRVPTQEPRYEMRGIDPISGLNWSAPTGLGTDRFYPWNLALYWAGNMDGYVSDFISCYNGALPNPNTVRKCRHYFNLADYGASVTIDYPSDLLPQWREIKSNTSKLLLSFQSSENDNLPSE